MVNRKNVMKKLHSMNYLKVSKLEKEVMGIIFGKLKVIWIICLISQKKIKNWDLCKVLNRMAKCWR
jgi:hypothetical protein